jgi:hypothetical protein
VASDPGARGVQEDQVIAGVIRSMIWNSVRPVQLVLGNAGGEAMGLGAGPTGLVAFWEPEDGVGERHHPVVPDHDSQMLGAAADSLGQRIGRDCGRWVIAPPLRLPKVRRAAK